MKSTLLIAIIVTLTVLAQGRPKYKPCTRDRHCKNEKCLVPGEVGYCHDRECHCHKANAQDCIINAHCRRAPHYCGRDAVCENGHCHGHGCTHHRK